MKLDYAMQRKIEAAIVEVLSAIGHKCRGRIEILDSDARVIEFESDEAGKWQHTSWHHKKSDDVFSIFPEFSVELPMLRKIKEAMK